MILQIPPMLWSIGQWYEHFEQLDDEEVCRLLELNRRAQKRLPAARYALEKPVPALVVSCHLPLLQCRYPHRYVYVITKY